MLNIELRVGIFLFKDSEEEKALQQSGAPNKFLLRRLRLPLNFVPNELDLKFDRLRESFRVKATRWDERSKLLIVFGEDKWWLTETYEPYIRRAFKQGYRILDSCYFGNMRFFVIP